MIATILACRPKTDGDNHLMADQKDKHQHGTIGKTYEIDRAAIDIFNNCLPKSWLLRKQDPDVFLDYLVEIVENREPTGRCFGVQIKGYEDPPNETKPLVYAFKTKHLDYYLTRSQHPVFLLLINVTSRDVFWLFSQKFLKEKAGQKIFSEQKSLTIHFSSDDNLFNLQKFLYLLPEAERFVRDLHPSSVKAAMTRRIAKASQTELAVTHGIFSHDRTSATIPRMSGSSSTTSTRSPSLNSFSSFIFSYC